MSAPSSNRYEVLVVGAGARTRERVEALIVDAAGYGGMARVRHASSLPDDDLAGYAAILIDARRPAAEWMRLATNPGLAWRSRVLLDIGEHPANWLAIHGHGGSPPVIAVGFKAEEPGAIEELGRMLYSDPVIMHLGPVLARACSTEQLALVNEFIRRSNAGTPFAVAKALARSRRSLDRDCERLGLTQPQVILQVARIARGLTWMILGRRNVDRAAAIAGYGQPSSFRRAARRTFGVPVSVLLGEWNDPARVEARLHRVLTRQAPPTLA